MWLVFYFNTLWFRSLKLRIREPSVWFTKIQKKRTAGSGYMNIEPKSPCSYYYLITRGLGEPIRVSRFFSKEINRFSKAMVLTNLIVVSFLVGSHNPDIKIIN
jgi:hypothetical protein